MLVYFNIVSSMTQWAFVCLEWKKSLANRNRTNPTEHTICVCVWIINKSNTNNFSSRGASVSKAKQTRQLLNIENVRRYYKLFSLLFGRKVYRLVAIYNMYVRVRFASLSCLDKFCVCLYGFFQTYTTTQTNLYSIKVNLESEKKKFETKQKNSKSLYWKRDDKNGINSNSDSSRHSRSRSSGMSC